MTFAPTASVKKARRMAKYRSVNKRVPAAPRGLSNMRKMIRSVQLSQAETKYKTGSFSVVNLTHDSIKSLPIWSSSASVFPTQGDAQNERVGDRITATSIKVRMSIDIPWDRKNTKIKMYYLPYNSDQGDPETYGHLFNNVTGNSMLDPINFKRWKGIRYLGMYTPKDNDAGSYRIVNTSSSADAPEANQMAGNTATIYVNRTIKLNRKAWFQDASNTQPTNFRENGTILVMPYASTNTSTLDNVVAKIEGAYTLYYKDL